MTAYKIRLSGLWSGLTLATVVGAITPLAFSPFDLWLLMPASLAVLFRLLDHQPPTRAALYGLGYGIGFYGTGVSWVYVSIHQFGGAGTPLAVVLTGLFVLALAAVFQAPLAWVYARLAHGQGNGKKVLLFSGLWVLADYWRSQFLTGFPWLYAGYTLLDTPWAGLAPVTGVHGLTLLLTLIATSLAALMREPGRTRLAATAVISAALCAVASLSDRHWTTPADTAPLSFAAVQGNIPQSIKWSPGFLGYTVQHYKALSAPHWDRDIVLWPENAIPSPAQRQARLTRQLQQQASTTRTALILGMPWQEQQRYYNALVGLGAADGHYLKQKLVPFGEFVPFSSWLRGLIAFFDLPMSSFASGPAEQPGLKIQGQPVATFICYEIVYPEFVARQSKDTGFILTVSNDTWFGRSTGPAQHLQMVRMRSLETGRYQLRTTNDGLTALIGPRGQLLNSARPWRSEVMTGHIKTMVGNTPFMQTGSWPSLLTAALMVVTGRMKKRRKTGKRRTS
ncbi:MAG: apolipoprotein N-acyltransferase [Kistimonas sp.]|nr:apolipoprotein N-acyltransferase [Kistimonas sp.]